MRTSLVAGFVVAAAAVVAALALRGCGDDGAPTDGTGAGGTTVDPAHTPRTGARGPRHASPRAGTADATPVEAAGDEPAPPEPTFDVRVLVEGTDEPVADVVLIVRPLRGGSAGGGKTDAEGRARMKVPAPGLVAVAVEGIGHRAMTDPTENRRDFVPPAAVVVPADRECVLRLRRAPVLRGRVVAPEGTTPQSFRVAVTALGGAGAGNSVYLQCGEDGAFSTPVDPGRHLVWVRDNGPGGAPWARTPVETVVPGGAEVVLHPRPVNPLPGTATSAGVVSGAEHHATVFALTSDGPESERQPPRRSAAFPGPFQWVAPDPERESDVWVRVGPRGSEPAVGWGVTRRVRADGRPVEVAVRPAWTLRVAAVDAKGAPVLGGLRCVLVPEGSRIDTPSPFGAWSEASSDGTFTFTGLPPLEMTAEVRVVESPEISGRARIAPWTASVTVAVDAGVELSGRLVAEDGSPVVIGWVEVAHSAPLTPLNADGSGIGEDGRFTLRGLVPGRTRLRWRFPLSFSVELGEVDVPAAGEITLKVPTSK